jgi:hypothetical protein
MLGFIASHDWTRWCIRYGEVASRGGSSVRFAFVRILVYRFFDSQEFRAYLEAFKVGFKQLPKSSL